MSYQAFFQVSGENSTKMGKISSRPSSISSISTSLLKVLKMEKLQVGPASSRPGPMLFRQDRTAEKLVPTE